MRNNSRSIFIRPATEPSLVWSQNVSSQLFQLLQFLTDRELQALPPGVELFEVYADYMRYLISYTSTFIRDTIGSDLWALHGSEAIVVLAHPNKWGATEQDFLREAAVAGGMIAPWRADSALCSWKRLRPEPAIAYRPTPGLLVTSSSRYRNLPCHCQQWRSEMSLQS